LLDQVDTRKGLEASSTGVRLASRN
jgi:hypothetical protein